MGKKSFFVFVALTVNIQSKVQRFLSFKIRFKKLSLSHSPRLSRSPSGEFNEVFLEMLRFCFPRPPPSQSLVRCAF